MSAKGVAEKACLDSKDPRRGTYHVSGFFEGSSGSPGIVFQNGKEHLVILRTRGFYHLGDHTRTAIEQGVFLTEIYKGVQKRIMNCQQDHNSFPLWIKWKLSQWTLISNSVCIKQSNL